MILSFSQKFPWGAETKFPEKILKGIKKTTIRKGNRWKVGDKIHFATGVRTKKYNCFAKGIVSSTLNILIQPTERRVCIGQLPENQKYGLVDSCSFRKGKRKGDYDLVVDSLDMAMIYIAKTDGFDSVDDFWRWFTEPLEGQLIFWELEK